MTGRWPDHETGWSGLHFQRCRRQTFFVEIERAGNPRQSKGCDSGERAGPRTFVRPPPRFVASWPVSSQAARFSAAGPLVSLAISPAWMVAVFRSLFFYLRLIVAWYLLVLVATLSVSWIWSGLGSLVQLLNLIDGYSLQTQRAVTIPLIKSMLDNV